MDVVAYLLPPVTGFLVYVWVDDEEARFHGLQSVVLGTVWPVILFVCSWISAGATRVMFAVGVLLWVALMAAAAAGRRLYLPFVGKRLERLSSSSLETVNSAVFREVADELKDET